MGSWLLLFVVIKKFVFFKVYDSYGMLVMFILSCELSAKAAFDNFKDRLLYLLFRISRLSLIA